MWTAFDYMYRDAGNFKAFGTVILDKELSQADRQMISERLDAGDNFIAEQIGVPPLYEQLYRWSDGATQCDHCWHEFIGFRDLARAPDEHLDVFDATAFISQFKSISEWDGSLSRHFGCGI
jgi:hypothetical protein